jgi:hypothetical protein
MQQDFNFQILDFIVDIVIYRRYICHIGNRSYMDLNIRQVDKESVKALKKSAVDAGVSLRDYCIRVLGIRSEGVVSEVVEGGGKTISATVRRSGNQVGGREVSPVRRQAVRRVETEVARPDTRSGGDEEAVVEDSLAPEEPAKRYCKNPDCGKVLQEKLGFWVCPDVNGCGLGGKQQGRAT